MSDRMDVKDDKATRQKDGNEKLDWKDNDGKADDGLENEAVTTTRDAVEMNAACVECEVKDSGRQELTGIGNDDG